MYMLKCDGVVLVEYLVLLHRWSLKDAMGCQVTGLFGTPCEMIMDFTCEGWSITNSYIYTMFKKYVKIQGHCDEFDIPT